MQSSWHIFCLLRYGVLGRTVNRHLLGGKVRAGNAGNPVSVVALILRCMRYHKLIHIHKQTYQVGYWIRIIYGSSNISEANIVH